jgi:sigma-E factor negative regulatory protein RseC
MIEATGRVMATGDGTAVVEIPRRSSCSSCASSGGCGVSTLAKLFSAGLTRVRIADPLGLRTGDRVAVGIGDGALAQASLLAYLLPILAMAAAAALAAQAGAGDIGSALAAALGLAGGLLLAVQLTRTRRVQSALRPVLIRRIAVEPLSVAIPATPLRPTPAHPLTKTDS